MRLRFTLNGSSQEIEAEPLDRALDVLRRAGLTGTKEGCGEGECGSCTVLMDGLPVNSCLVIASQLDDSEVVTVEGLASGDVLSALQRLFIEHGATQCGICTPGFLITAEYLLREASGAGGATASRFDVATIRKWARGDGDGALDGAVDREVRGCLAGNICRCTGYDAIVRAVKDALRDALATPPPS